MIYTFTQCKLLSTVTPALQFVCGIQLEPTSCKVNINPLFCVLGMYSLSRVAKVELYMACSRLLGI